jgi:hypothetical protein
VNGANNLASGASCGNTVNGDANQASGVNCGENVTGQNNVAQGDDVGNHVTGVGNQARGASSGSRVTGDYNQASGYGSGNDVGGVNWTDANGDPQSTSGGVNNIATGYNTGNHVYGASNVAMGQDSGNQVYGINNLALGTGAGNGIGLNGAPVFDTIAIGTNANAGSTYGIAVGSGTSAVALGSVAIGTDAYGNGAQASLFNQVVIGTKEQTYTTPGITSDFSRSRQSGPIELVTSDANGNLATDNGFFTKTLDEHASGIALAMATQNPDLTGPEVFGISGNFGTFAGAYAFAVSAMGVVGHDVLQPGDRIAVSGGAGVGFANGLGTNQFGAHLGVQWTR